MRASDFATALDQLASRNPQASAWCALLSQRLRLHPEDSAQDFAARLALRPPVRRRHSTPMQPSRPLPDAAAALCRQLAAARLDIRSISMAEIDSLCAEAAGLTLAHLRRVVADAGFVHLDARTKPQLLDRLTQTLKNARASHH